MYKHLLPLLGLTIASTIGLRADSLTIESDISGSGSMCNGETACESAAGGSSVYATNLETVTATSIALDGVADLTQGVGTPHVHYRDTFTLPDSWSKAELNFTLETSGTFLYSYFLAYFSQPGMPLLPVGPLFTLGSQTLTLGPGSARDITLDYNAGGMSPSNSANFTLTVINIVPAPVPEPASAALVTLPILAFGFARWKRRK